MIAPRRYAFHDDGRFCGEAEAAGVAAGTAPWTFACRRLLRAGLVFFDVLITDYFATKRSAGLVVTRQKLPVTGPCVWLEADVTFSRLLDIVRIFKHLLA